MEFTIQQRLKYKYQKDYLDYKQVSEPYTKHLD